MVFCTFYLYTLDRFNIRYNILSLLPCFTIYFLVSAMQYNVGTDYFTYINIYNHQFLYERYYDVNEFVFYYTVKLSNFLDLPEQSLFFFFSLLQSIPIFIYLSVMRNKYKLNVFILFFIYMTVTGIYINQLNGIRQYAALTLFPLISFLCFERRYLLSLILILFSISLHQSAFIFIVVFPLVYFYRKTNIPLFFIFLITCPIYIFGTELILYLVKILELKYTSYFDSEYSEPKDILNLLTRLYYLPLLLYFFYIYKRNGDRNYFDFSIFLFCIFYFSFIMGLDFGLLSRIASYFWFFIVFPLYYIINDSIKKGQSFSFIVFVIYVLVPFLLKTTIFAKAEYLYQSILFT
ncbi:TPA: EpsG family protein [Providencia rettgeri]